MKVLKYKKKRGKLENNWLFKSLESLEKDDWGAVPVGESYLVTSCYRVRKKPLNSLEIEDIRMLIGQNLGLKYVIPLALKILQKNILAEGDFYEGDLLKSVLTSDPDYWKIEREDWNTVIALYENNLEIIKNEAAEYETGRALIKAFKDFERIK
ncbi:contact-dependent growth inhibition system immunity protein [Flagellimonas sp. DF-77]|uniref:contact-dependent growth inhibition system immunity protein n=1 Tax=Flagellimonas algarum TaxID=3230298 RepID=UPI00339B243C